MTNKYSWLVTILYLLAAGTLFADPPPVLEKSPDGKWCFQASWYLDKGYIWQLQDLSTGKSYPLQGPPGENEGLPRRIGALWSADSHYVAINIYYGRILYGINVIAVSPSGVKEVDWPEGVVRDMLKPEDLKLWDGTGVLNSSITKWEEGDVLVVILDMHTTLVDKETKYRIDSERTQKIRFNGDKAKVVNNGAPAYDREPAN